MTSPSSQSKRRRVALLIGVVMLMGLAGCTPKACLSENLPPTQKRLTAKSAVEFFQYAFGNSCWDLAHQTLDKEDRESISPTDIAISSWLGPNLKGISTDQFMKEAKVKWVFPAPPGKMVKLSHPKVDENLSLFVHPIPDETWRISFIESERRDYLFLLHDEEKDK